MAISDKSRVFWNISVALRQIARTLYWSFGPEQYTDEYGQSSFPYVVAQHQSLLIRKLKGTDFSLQANKVDNLKIAAPKISGMLIKPGQTFSLCRAIGRPDKSSGYRPGLQINGGKLGRGIGGGLCQIANIIHWMALHTKLDIIERHHHSYDLFPDNSRTTPFGSGATMFYNYKDLCLKNNTPNTYQIILEIRGDYLKGEIRLLNEPEYCYEVYEKNHQFVIEDGICYRQNELWRRDFKSGGDDEFILSNRSAVKYKASVMILPDACTN